MAKVRTSPQLLIMAVLLNSADVRTQTVNYYVATDGNDSTGDGSIGNPWATLDGARLKLQPILAGNISWNIAVNFREGTYRLSDTVVFGLDDFDETYNVTYQAYPGETVTLTSADTNTYNWTANGDGSYRTTLTDSVPVNNLIVNGSKCTPARWPKEDGDIFHVMDATAMGGAYPPVPPDGKSIAWDKNYADPTAMLDLANNPKTIVATISDFICEQYYVESVTGDYVVTTEPTPLAAEIGKPTAGHGWHRYYGRHYFRNNRNFVTAPGDFYYDEANETLHYYPQVGEDMAAAVVEIPQLNTLIQVQGKSAHLPALAEDFTFSIWFKTTSTADQVGLFCNEFWTGAGIGIDILNGNQIELDYYGNEITTAVDATLSDGNWHHVAVSVNGVANTAEIYIDGTSRTLSPDNSIGTQVAATVAFRLGRSAESPAAQWFDGEMDDFIITNRVATAQDITDLYAQDYSNLQDAIVCEMLFDDKTIKCDTVVDINWETITAFNGRDSRPQLVDGGAGHNPCVSFDGADDFLGTQDYPGQQVKNIYFEGFELVGCKHVGLTPGGSQDPDGSESYWADFNNPLNLDMPAMVKFEYAANCGLRNCEVHNTTGTGIYANISENITVMGCKVYDIGHWGIILSANGSQAEDGAGKSLNRDDKYPKRWEGHWITGCEIYNVGQLQPQSAGIHLWHVSRTQITDNYLHHCPYCAFLVADGVDFIDRGFADIKFLRNVVTTSAYMMPDGGAVYPVGRCPGGEVANNRIENNVHTAYHDFYRTDEVQQTWKGSVTGLHVDGGHSWHLHRNLIVGESSEGIWIGGSAGREMIIENNTIVDVVPGRSCAIGLNMIKKVECYDGDGTPIYDTMPVPITVRNNIYSSSTGQAGLLMNYLTQTVRQYFIDAGGIGDISSNWYTNDRTRLRLNNTTMDVNEYTLEWPRQPWLSVPYDDDDSGIEAGDTDSIEDPGFVDAANGDYTVTNSVILNGGFENFDVPELPI